MSQLSSVADSMRKCADIADHFSQVVAHLGPNGTLPPMPHFHNGPMADMSKMGPPPQTAVVPTPANGKRKAQSMADGVVKKKKVKKPRDPDAPKRPPSSYLLFQNEVRQAMKKANPGMANHEILTTISQRWASMTPEEKDTYHKRQEVAKAHYTQEKTAYDARRVLASDEVIEAQAAAPATTLSPVIVHAPPPSAAIKPEKAPVPIVADTSTSDEDDSSEGETSESDSSDEEDDEAQPVQKKAKKATTSKQPTAKKETRKKINKV